MIGRRVLRIKVLQHVYAFHLSGNDDLVSARNNLIKSIADLSNIFYINLYFFFRFIKFYEERIEENKKKLIPSEEDLKPNLVLIDNFYINSLLSNKKLNIEISDLSPDFAFENDMLWDIYKKMKDWYNYKSFIKKRRYILEDYQKFYSKFFKQFIAFHPLLKSYLESGDLSWVDDQNTMALVTYMLSLIHI